MQMSNQQQRRSQNSALLRDYPCLFMLARVAAFISIGRWMFAWSVSRGKVTPMVSSSYAIEKDWTPVPSVRLTLRRYYALPEPTTARTD